MLANQTMGYGDPYASLGIVPPALLEEGEEQREVTVIKAKPKVELIGSKGKLRVAAYCRVSTDQEDQEGSYEAQCSHYRALIQGKKEWSLAGIYADEGISGTNRTHREQFNRMVEDAEAGNSLWCYGVQVSPDLPEYRYGIRNFNIVRLNVHIVTARPGIHGSHTALSSV